MSAPPSSSKSKKSFEIKDKAGIVFTLSKFSSFQADQSGILNKALNVLTNNNINLTRIESKPSKYYREERAHDFYIDFKGTLQDENVAKMISELSKMSKHLTVTGTPEVPWFPTHISDLDKIGKTILREGEGIEAVDHPSFNDKAYKERRDFLT